MMSVYVRPFKASDLNAFVPIEPLEEDKLKDLELAKAIEESNLAVTGIRNGRIFGCAGVHPIDDIHGEVWLRLSAECLKHKLDTLRWIISGLKIVEETYPFRQLDAAIECTFERSIKMIEFLGFKRTQKKDGKWYIYSKRVKE